MNNRKIIQQLASKAREFATTKDAFGEYAIAFDSENFEQKFAELIVRECLALSEEVSVLDAMENEEFGSAAMCRVAEAAYEIYRRKIEEHFGVEEP